MFSVHLVATACMASAPQPWALATHCSARASRSVSPSKASPPKVRTANTPPAMRRGRTMQQGKSEAQGLVDGHCGCMPCQTLPQARRGGKQACACQGVQQEGRRLWVDGGRGQGHARSFCWSLTLASAPPGSDFRATGAPGMGLGIVSTDCMGRGCRVWLSNRRVSRCAYLETSTVAHMRM